MRLPSTCWCMALGIVTLAACSRDQPAAPGLHSITGNVRMTGSLVNVDGHFAGTRVLDDVDGVPVELLHGRDVVARTTTANGAYRFSGLSPGDYVARSRVIGDFGDQTDPMVIAAADVAAGTLQLTSGGDLLPAPNPFADSIRVFFTVNAPAQVEVGILDVGGNAVKNLLSLELQPARYGLIWNGRDQTGRPVTGSLFWVTYVAGDDIRAHLLFKGTPAPRRAASR